jgi:hypothetical protein
MPTPTITTKIAATLAKRSARLALVIHELHDLTVGLWAGYMPASFGYDSQAIHAGLQRQITYPLLDDDALHDHVGKFGARRKHPLGFKGYRNDPVGFQLCPTSGASREVFLQKLNLLEV